MNMTLSEENDYLKARVAHLEDALTEVPPSVLLAWGLTPTEQTLIGVLMRRAPNLVTTERLLTVLYDGRDEPDPKIVTVLVCKARKKIISRGWYIKTHWGQGYSMAEGEEDEQDTGKRTRMKMPDWTPIEDDMLRQSLSIPEAVKRIGRTRMAVWARANRIGHRWRLTEKLR